MKVEVLNGMGWDWESAVGKGWEWDSLQWGKGSRYWDNENLGLWELQRKGLV